MVAAAGAESIGCTALIRDNALEDVKHPPAQAYPLHSMECTFLLATPLLSTNGATIVRRHAADMAKHVTSAACGTCDHVSHAGTSRMARLEYNAVKAGR